MAASQMVSQPSDKIRSQALAGPLRRWGYAALACLALLIAFAGLLLPLLPATPFILLSVWLAAKGSPRLHGWIWNHPRLGSCLRAWHEQGAISKQAKWLASIMLLTSWFVVSIRYDHWIALTLITLFFIIIGLFIWSRPTAIGQSSMLHGNK